MREIKFRVWCNERKEMLQIQRHSFKTNKSMPYGWNLEYVFDDIMQYTGILDFNGVEVYEGDIIKLIEDRNRDDIFEPFIAGQVKFRNGSFYITDGAISRFRWEDYVVEVVGNIYENPELLEV